MLTETEFRAAHRVSIMRAGIQQVLELWYLKSLKKITQRTKQVLGTSGIAQLCVSEKCFLTLADLSMV